MIMGGAFQIVAGLCGHKPGRSPWAVSPLPKSKCDNLECTLMGSFSFRQTKNAIDHSMQSLILCP